MSLHNPSSLQKPLKSNLKKETGTAQMKLLTSQRTWTLPLLTLALLATACAPNLAPPTNPSGKVFSVTPQIKPTEPTPLKSFTWETVGGGDLKYSITAPTAENAKTELKVLRKDFKELSDTFAIEDAILLSKLEKLFKGQTVVSGDLVESKPESADSKSESRSEDSSILITEVSDLESAEANDVTSAAGNEANSSDAATAADAEAETSADGMVETDMNSTGTWSTITLIDLKDGQKKIKSPVINDTESKELFNEIRALIESKIKK